MLQRRLLGITCFDGRRYLHGVAASALPRAVPRQVSTVTNQIPIPMPKGESDEEVVHREAGQLPLTTGRPRLVILGTGWAGCRLIRDIDPKKYDFTMISPRNHMVFTPLLAATTVGTLDPRSVTVHVTQIQKALHAPQNQFYMASCKRIDIERQKVHCDANGVKFDVHYDKLAICTGSQGSTFGIPGVETYTHYLRDVRQATAIRNKLIENLGRAALPGHIIDKEWCMTGRVGNSQEEFSRYLTVVVVGGGPTGVEFAGELCDFVREDLSRLYPHRARSIRYITQQVLGSFDASLREYAAKKLTKQGVFLMKGTVKEVEPTCIRLTNGDVIRYGLCVWSTGVGPTKFISSLPMRRTETGRLAIDDYLRVLRPSIPSQNGDQDREDRSHLPNIYALGDCCAHLSSPLPALAQVAEQQGKYLAKMLNDEAMASTPHSAPEPFVYRHLGSMATVGRMSAIIQLSHPHLGLTGFSSWVAWRSAYLTRLGTIRNRLYVAFNWTITFLFGRDLSRW